MSTARPSATRVLVGWTSAWAQPTACVWARLSAQVRAIPSSQGRTEGRSPSGPRVRASMRHYESQPARAARTPASKRLRASRRTISPDTVRRAVRSESRSFLPFASSVWPPAERTACPGHYRDRLWVTRHNRRGSSPPRRHGPPARPSHRRRRQQFPAARVLLGRHLFCRDDVHVLPRTAAVGPRSVPRSSDHERREVGLNDHSMPG